MFSKSLDINNDIDRRLGNLVQTELSTMSIFLTVVMSKGTGKLFGDQLIRVLSR